MIDLKKINNTPIGLLNLGYNLLIEPNKYISIIFFNELLKSLMVMSLFMESSKDSFGNYIILILINPIIISIIQMIMSKYITYLDMKTFQKWEYIVYNFFQELSYTDRKKYENMEDLKSKVNQTGWTLCRLIFNGFPTIIRIILVSCNAIYLVIKSKYYILFIIIPSSLYLYYEFRMKRKQQFLDIIRKKNSELTTKMCPLSHWYLHLYQNRKRTTTELLAIKNEIHKLDIEFMCGWEKINKELIIMINIITACSLGMFYNDIKTLLVSKIVFDELTTAIQSIIGLSNCLIHNMKDFDLFLKWVKEVKNPEPLIEANNIIYPINIENINISLGEFKLETTNLTIEANDNILLRGPSGIGKTQLVNSLQGLIPGTIYKNMNAKETEIWWEYMNQQTREAIPSSGLSIRQMLEDETNDKIILDLINVVSLTYIFKADNLDKPMEALSGGEKMRLSLLYTLWELDKRNKEILILDEPEQGLDEDTRVEVIKKIMEYVKKPILIIYHGSKLDLLELPLSKAWLFSKKNNKSVVIQKNWTLIREEISQDIKKIID